jgi:hypothetical protein
MTDIEWQVCTDPAAMLDFLREQAGDRKCRLFACACCRRVWRLLPDESCREAVRAAEQYADGLLPEEELRSWANAALAGRNLPRGVLLDSLRSLARAAAAVTWVERFSPAMAREAADDILRMPHYWEVSAEQSAQADLLRDLFGFLPFRPVSLPAGIPAWNDYTVAGLAQAIYYDRAFEQLPILADALEDAGCTVPDILQHCRSGGEHVRGCWVLDLILGKS